VSDPLDELELDGDTEEGETKGERTRRKLLSLAIERFGERGYRATSVSEVARAAGLTQAAVYAYFDGKEALFDAAVDADAEAVIEAVRADLEGSPPNALIPAFLMYAMGSLDAHPLVHRVLRGDEKDALVRLLNLPALDSFTRWLGGELAHGQQSGLVRADVDPYTIAEGAEPLILGLLMAVVQVGGSHEQRRQLGVLAVFDAVIRPPG
jgi:AcrR family transcriptional regulator